MLVQHADGNVGIRMTVGWIEDHVRDGAVVEN